MIRVLIVGSGDVARRLLPTLVNRFRVYALVRDPENAAWWREHRVVPIVADLDRRSTLSRLRGLAHWVLHFAPPCGQPDRRDLGDSRTRHLIASLSSSPRRRASLPQRLVYISTSGVYGDCAGERIDETRRPAPANARAARRLDAERRLRRWSRRGGARVTILRVPGIYAADRLPLSRLAAGTPLLRDEDDVFTNHIHADDLAHAAWCALRRGGNNRVVNVSDDSELRLGEYFDVVADAFGLARPERIPRAAAAARLPPALLSFMTESRRLDNARMKNELGVRLAWPRVDDAVKDIAGARKLLKDNR